MYRARNWSAVRNFSVEKHGALGGDIGRSLRASVLGEPNLCNCLPPLFGAWNKKGLRTAAVMPSKSWRRQFGVPPIKTAKSPFLDSQNLPMRYCVLAAKSWNIARQRLVGHCESRFQSSSQRPRDGTAVFAREPILLHRRAEGRGLDLKVPRLSLCSLQPAVAE